MEDLVGLTVELYIYAVAPGDNGPVLLTPRIRVHGVLQRGEDSGVWCIGTYYPRWSCEDNEPRYIEIAAFKEDEVSEINGDMIVINI